MVVALVGKLHRFLVVGGVHSIAAGKEKKWHSEEWIIPNNAKSGKYIAEAKLVWTSKTTTKTTSETSSFSVLQSSHRESECVAEILEIGCTSGTAKPKIACSRKGGQKVVDAQPGMKLNVGDKILLEGFSKKNRCSPYIVLKWGNVKGKAMLASDVSSCYIKIGENAVESGWPSTWDTINYQGSGIFWNIISNTPTEQIVGGYLGTVLTCVSFALTPSKPAISGSLITLYVESDLLIHHTPDSFVMYTVEGNPTVQYDDINYTVKPGMKIDVKSGNVIGPTKYEISEIVALKDEFGEISRSEPTSGQSTCNFNLFS